MTTRTTTKRHRTQEVALLIASAAIPRSFQASLLKRSLADQGIVTGLTVVMVYLLGLITQDVIAAGSAAFTPNDQPSEDETEGNTVSESFIIASLAAVGVGYLAERMNPYSKDEKLARSAVRTTGYWLRNSGWAGLIHSGIVAANTTVSSDKQAARQRDLLAYLMAAGVLVSLAGEYLKTRKDDSFSLVDSVVASKPVRAVGIGAGVAAGLAGLAYTERTVARTVDKGIESVAPRFKHGWLPIGHLVGGGMLLGGLYVLLKKTYAKIEHQAGLFETGFNDAPANNYVSGGPASLIAWDSLSVQGRRHVSTSLNKVQIEAVMSEDAMDPIRVYVGLDSADTEIHRIELAMAELEHLGAFDRETLLVVSPTGTGYVNYVMSEAVEYLSRGNVTSVTLQYSKRPSPMSLDKVDRGHIQYRLLLNAIRRKLVALPPSAHRPRIILFGESLGAWTSQDAFMHEGTDGLRSLQVDRALWIGTPAGSKWREQAVSTASLNSERELIGQFNSYEDIERLGAEERAAIRYVILTHHNDPIAQFGLSLLIKQPEWVTDKRKRPAGMSPTIRYRSPALFIQTLIDMKNALKPEPGNFVASAHDYRADLANFVAFAFGFTADDEQLFAIEAALRNNEVTREARIKYGQ